MNYFISFYFTVQPWRFKYFTVNQHYQTRKRHLQSITRSLFFGLRDDWYDFPRPADGIRQRQRYFLGLEGKFSLAEWYRRPKQIYIFIEFGLFCFNKLKCTPLRKFVTPRACRNTVRVHRCLSLSVRVYLLCYLYLSAFFLACWFPFLSCSLLFLFYYSDKRNTANQYL